MSKRTILLSLLTAGFLLVGCGADSSRDARSPGETWSKGAVCQPSPNKALR